MVIDPIWVKEMPLAGDVREDTQKSAPDHREDRRERIDLSHLNDKMFERAV